jgi:hypothetical protein
LKPVTKVTNEKSKSEKKQNVYILYSYSHITLDQKFVYLYCVVINEEIIHIGFRQNRNIVLYLRGGSGLFLEENNLIYHGFLESESHVFMH